MVIVTHSCIPFLVVRKHHLKGISAVSHFFFVLHLDCKFKMQKSESIRTLYQRYLRQEISMDQFLQEVERALEMSRLEEQ